jgi:hypothetical protein
MFLTDPGGRAADETALARGIKRGPLEPHPDLGGSALHPIQPQIKFRTGGQIRHRFTLNKQGRAGFAKTAKPALLHP